MGNERWARQGWQVKHGEASPWAAHTSMTRGGQAEVGLVQMPTGLEEGRLRKSELVKGLSATSPE